MDLTMIANPLNTLLRLIRLFLNDPDTSNKIKFYTGLFHALLGRGIASTVSSGVSILELPLSFLFARLGPQRPFSEKRLTQQLSVRTRMPSLWETLTIETSRSKMGRISRYLSVDDSFAISYIYR